MVYSIQKIRHYPLATLFMFYVDHQTLMCLVDKAIIHGRVSIWLLLVLEFTFTIVVWLGKSYVMED